MALNNALKLKSPALAEATAGYDEQQLRALSSRLAAGLVAKHHLEQQEVAAGLAALQQQEYGNETVIANLSGLADRIEAPYLNALDRNEDVVANARLMALFEQARAITVLYLALSPDIGKDGGNAIYEALYAGLSEADILELIAS